VKESRSKAVIGTKAVFLAEDNNCSTLQRTGKIYQQTKLISKREGWKGFDWNLAGVQSLAVSSVKKFCIFSKNNMQSYLQRNSD